MFIRRLIGAVLGGAATTIGSIIAVKGFEYLSNPVNRAKIKKTFANLKFKFVKGKEA